MVGVWAVAAVTEARHGAVTEVTEERIIEEAEASITFPMKTENDTGKATQLRAVAPLRGIGAINQAEDA